MHFDSFFLWIGLATSAYFTFGSSSQGSGGFKFFNQFFLRLTLALIGIFFSKGIFHFLNPGSEILWNGGFVYIGFLSSFIIYYLVEVFCGKSVKISDSFVVSLLSSYSIGRVGCYIAGCCFGEVFVIPVQLFESFACASNRWRLSALHCAL